MIISIIIPVKNAQQTIKNTLDSIKNQTAKNYEIIICDDNSTDNTLKIIKKHEIKEKIILIKNQETKGIGYSRNKAIQKSNGNYTLFLDADDKLDKNTIKSLTNEIKKSNPECILFRHYLIKNNKTYSDKINGFKLKKKPDKKSIFSLPTVCWQFCINKKKLTQKKIRFKSIIHEDIPFFLDILLNMKITFLNKKLYYYNKDNSKTSTNKGQKNFEIHKLCFLIWNNYKNKLNKHDLKKFIAKIYLTTYFKLNDDLQLTFIKKTITTFTHKYNLKFVKIFNSPLIIKTIRIKLNLLKKIYTIKTKFIYHKYEIN